MHTKVIHDFFNKLSDYYLKVTLVFTFSYVMYFFLILKYIHSNYADVRFKFTNQPRKWLIIFSSSPSLWFSQTHCNFD